MITNAREYGVTRSQVARLRQMLDERRAAGAGSGVHAAIHEAELAAIESEACRLEGEMAEYDDLRSGGHSRLIADSIEALPELMIKARIANRLTQRELAERIGVHAQQIQRYEATRYRGASLERLMEVADALGVQATTTCRLPRRDLSVARGVLRGMGFDDCFLSRRILPPTGDLESISASEASAALHNIEHVFGVPASQFSAGEPVQVPALAAGGARFKAVEGRDPVYGRAYAAYAYRLAVGAAKCAQHIESRELPSDATTTRAQLLERGPVSLTGVVDWAWRFGVVVLPLQDRAAFNGAFWRVDGRNVIMIKQRTHSAERLMHDLLHELYHASREPDALTRSVLDTEDYLTSNNSEEADATEFASDVLLDSRSNDLVLEVARVAGSYGPALKSAVTSVAKREGVSCGALANHLAWVLCHQDPPITWWGTAQNLQTDADDGLNHARMTAWRQLRPPDEHDEDVELLFRALRDEGF